MENILSSPEIRCFANQSTNQPASHLPRTMNSRKNQMTSSPIKFIMSFEENLGEKAEYRHFHAFPMQRRATITHKNNIFTIKFVRISHIDSFSATSHRIQQGKECLLHERNIRDEQKKVREEGKRRSPINSSHHQLNQATLNGYDSLIDHPICLEW